MIYRVVFYLIHTFSRDTILKILTSIKKLQDYKNKTAIAMQIRQEYPSKQIKIRDNPLHRSSSVGGIIHGVPSNNSNHYIDALQRFQRDFAAVDKNQRQNKRYLKERNYQRRREHIIERENNIKKMQDQNLNKMKERQYHSQMLHQMGGKRTAHTQSIAVNPINLKYEQNYRGKYQEYLDQQNRVNKLVRAHNLVTQGTSGYNIITGRPSMHVESLVPPQQHQAFQQKLTQFYSKYKLDPNANQ